jgi:ubiquinone/menaquinone biosynthesis C-methylase UbiE
MLAITDPVKMKAAAAYNAAADHFDDEALGLWAKYGGRTVERLALQPGARVLDVGCGTGASAIPAAEQVGPKGKVIAVDLADRLLENARRKAATLKLENIEFRLGDMENLGYPDQYFDAVVCVFAIFFVPDVTRQVRELWRMVRPNGRLAITTWGPRVWEPGSTGWRLAVKQLRPDLHAAFNPWDRIADPASLRKLFTEAGVAEAEILAEDGTQALRSPQDWWTMVLGSGYRWTVDQMEPEMAERLRHANLAWIRSHNITSVETNVIYAAARKPRWRDRDR